MPDVATPEERRASAPRTTRRSGLTATTRFLPTRVSRATSSCTATSPVGDHCLLLGSLKARKLAEIGRGTRVTGSIIAMGNLYVAPECVVQGALVGESDIFIDERVRIGSEARPTTVTAERIDVAPGVVSHGVSGRAAGAVARF